LLPISLSETKLLIARKNLCGEHLVCSDDAKIKALVTEELDIMGKPKAARNRRSAQQTFADVATLLASPSERSWVSAFLEWWAQGICHDRMYDDARPTKAETRNKLQEIGATATLLQDELNRPAIRNLLAGAKSSHSITLSCWLLRDVAERAAFASSLLSDGQGKTKRGRGKPKVPDLFGARALCAARIVEAWLFFRGKEPGLRNRQAAAAAEAYWLASGGRSDGYGDPLNGWYHYFKIVRENKNSIGLKRLIWRRDLKQVARNRRPPWYIGTYFPVEQPEFKSPVQIHSAA
jgi:hypothetical protein